MGLRTPLALGVLISGRGTNLQSILDAIQQERLNAAVKVVVSNVAGVSGLERARTAGIPTAVVNHKSFSGRPAFEQALVQVLREHGAEWIALAGFMRVLTSEFLSAFPGRVLNIHPALLPSFPGVHAQRQALDYGVKFSGCTVHFVDEGTDTGPILGQAVVPVEAGDDEDRLAARILAAEHRLYPEMLQAIAEGRVQRDGRHVQVLRSDEIPTARTR